MQKRVVILQHAPHEGPGYLAEFLSRRGVPFRVVRIDRREPLPESLATVSGLVLMGGPMSANDPFPWIQREIAFIREAVKAGVPVLGHCLGAQLLSKALGGRVRPNHVREIGWLPVEVVDAPDAHRWTRELPRRFEVFHWHGETFSLPEGAHLILRSAACRNQAFVMGPHLGLQCHLEMTPELVRSWLRVGRDELARPSPTVQTPLQIRTNLVSRAARLQRIADVFYGQWLSGVLATADGHFEGFANVSICVGTQGV